MIKRKGLVCLTAACLSLSVAGAAISLSNSDYSGQISYAETVAFDTAQAVSVSGATVTAGADKSGSVTHKGLLVEPAEEKGSYSGTLNAILPADSTIGYTFPGSLHGNGSSMWIDFTFRFTSVKTQEWFEVYTVMINGNWWNSLMVRDMDGNTRTTWKWGGGWYETAQDDGYMYPQYGGSNLTAGYLKTAYVDGVLSIDVLSAEQNVTLAKFDSDIYSSINNDNLVCGFEKIDFSEGYILSFSANSAGNEATASLLIESINGQSFENASWEAEPSWYASYASIPMITLSSEIAEAYTVEEPFTVPAATYTTLNDATEKSVAKIELQKDGGEWQSVSVGDAISEVGNYVIKYTAIEGGIALGNTLEKSFSLVGKGFDMRDVVTVSGATVTAGADKSGSVTHKGLLVEPAEEKGSYNGTINAVLPADSTIKYNLPGSGIVKPYTDFTFRFTSVKTGEWFEVYTVMINDDWWNSMELRDMEGHTRTTWQWGGENWWEHASEVTSNYADGQSWFYSYPQYGNNDLAAGAIRTAYVDGVMTVYALSRGSEVMIAKFDSETYASIGDGICGLKKIDFSEGYRVSFSASSINGVATAPLLIESINGEALTGNTINNWNYLGYEYVEQDLAVYSDGTKIVDGSDLGVKFNYTATLGSLTFAGTKVVSPDLSGLDLLTDNTSKVTYSFNGQTVIRDVKVLMQYTATVTGLQEDKVIKYTSENKTDKLAELIAMLPENTAEYSYAWQTALPEELPLENATYAVVRTANEYTVTVTGAVSGSITFTVENRAEKLDELRALLPASGGGYSYTWQEALPDQLPFANATYTVVKTAVEYTITFANADGVEPIKFTVETIGSVQFPEVPAKVGYSNGAWDKTETELTLENITVTATYKVGNVYGASVSTKGDIAMNFYITLSETTLADENAYIEFDFEGEKINIKLSEGVNKNEYYVYSYSVSAKNYDKQITLTVFATEGEGVSVTYSVKDYAANIISGEYSAVVKELVASLVDYCECAKAYFAGETAEAKFTDVTADALSGYAARVEGTEPEGVTVLGASLILETKTSIRVYFVGENAATAVVKVGGAEVEAKILEQNENVYYYVEISDISAKDLDAAYTVEIGDFKVTYSALSYVQANIESENVALLNVLKSMYVYNQKADAYAESTAV